MSEWVRDRAAERSGEKDKAIAQGGKQMSHLGKL